MESLLLGLTFPGLSAQIPLMTRGFPLTSWQQSVKFSSSQVIRCNVSARLSISAARELSDQQIVAESSEIGWSPCHPPGSVQQNTEFETQQEISCGAINIHKP